ncbi:Dihydrolipoamide acyltransferase, partial [Giardia duodenalis]
VATEEEMRKALFGTLNKKASGVSGLGRSSSKR